MDSDVASLAWKAEIIDDWYMKADFASPTWPIKFGKHIPGSVSNPMCAVICDQLKDGAEPSFTGKVFIVIDTFYKFLGSGSAENLVVTDSTRSADYTLHLKGTKDFRLAENETLTDTSVEEKVHLKFKSLGRCFTVVYGSLSDGTSDVHRVCFNENIHGPALRFLSESKLEYPREVFQLLEMVRERLILPLINDLCGKAKLKPPAHFMHLLNE